MSIGAFFPYETLMSLSNTRGCFMASSDSTFRSSPMFRFFKSDMKREYVVPERRVAALMRICWSARLFRFFNRRPRWACQPDFTAAVFASLILDLRPHIMPLVRRRMFFRRLMWCVPRLTRGIASGYWLPIRVLMLFVYAPDMVSSRRFFRVILPRFRALK